LARPYSLGSDLVVVLGELSDHSRHQTALGSIEPHDPTDDANEVDLALAEFAEEQKEFAGSTSQSV
jgi:hypothetical protein